MGRGRQAAKGVAGGPLEGVMPFVLGADTVILEEDNLGYLVGTTISPVPSLTAVLGHINLKSAVGLGITPTTATCTATTSRHGGPKGGF